MVMTGRTKDLVLVGLFAALTAVGALLQVPFLPDVPMTLQTLFVVMAGLLLGPKGAFYSQVVYLLLGLVGLPVFAKGRGGLAHVASPTFGFLLGFILGAPVTGWVDRFLHRWPLALRSLAAAAAGIAVIYGLGVPWVLLFRTFTGNAIPFGVFIVSLVPIMLGDVLKIIAAGFLRPAIVKTLPELER